MADRYRPLTSPSGLNIVRHRSHSHRERNSRTTGDSHRQRIDHVQRRFDDELADSERELQLAMRRQNNYPLSPREYLATIRAKYKIDYNQRMQERVEEVEKDMNERCDEERRLAKRKLRKAQIANEQYRLQSINQVLRERDAVYENRLAVQRSQYDRLLDEQARRIRAEQNLQTFDQLNIDQLKERLTRVERSNNQLTQVIHSLINREPVYRSTVYIPNFVI